MSYSDQRRQRSRSRQNQKQYKRQEFRGTQRTDFISYEGRFKFQETKMLMFEGVLIEKSQVERIFMDLSISIGTSVPDDVQMQGNKGFIKYPSIEAATSIYNSQNGQLILNGNSIKLQYFPIRRIDLSLAYDWYCQKCDYKNFGRRNKCYRCDADKTPSCRLSYSTQPATKSIRGDQSAQNCSLMLRAPFLSQIDENVLLQIFESIVPIKDIRQIKNKLTGKFKDFAFIQFFTPEDTTIAFQEATNPNFKIHGQRISVMYSRNKSDDDYSKPLPYQNSRRERKPKERQQQEGNYYQLQRQKQIQEQKERPTITMQQLKEKRQQELKKQQPAPKQLTAEQAKRRQAELLAKQWEKQMKTVATMYICPACSRKFKDIQQMKLHQSTSELHKFHMKRIQAASLAI